MAADMETNTMLILGAGYSGKAVARRLLARGWTVRGTSRSEAGVERLRRAGIVGDIAGEGRLPADLLTGATALLASIPPNDDGDPMAQSVAEHLGNGRGTLRWIGYLSTTGVYGDTGGAWVDESAAANPSNARGRRRLLAEAQWLELGRRAGIAVQIFRLPGIYGPGRSALDDVRAGKARRIDKPGQAFSRIHVEDIAATVEAALARPRAGAIYNVADDLPAPSADVVAYACELLGTQPPPLIPFADIEPTLSPMSREFYADNRRLKNDRIKRELGVKLAYPDYRAGLRAILAGEKAAG